MRRGDECAVGRPRMSNEFLLFAFSVSAMLCGYSDRTPLTTENAHGGHRECTEKKHGQEVLK